VKPGCGMKAAISLRTVTIAQAGLWGSKRLFITCASVALQSGQSPTIGIWFILFHKSYSAMLRAIF
ncbi:MAG: hypothetical protein WBA76_05105, partial [Phormidesmis sp.]